MKLNRFLKTPLLISSCIATAITFTACDTEPEPEETDVDVIEPSETSSTVTPPAEPDSVVTETVIVAPLPADPDAETPGTQNENTTRQGQSAGESGSAMPDRPGANQPPAPAPTRPEASTTTPGTRTNEVSPDVVIEPGGDTGDATPENTRDEADPAATSNDGAN